jgi:hypothetical protein
MSGLAGPRPDDTRPVIRPSHIGAFEFVVLSSLRAAQLMRGCLPRIPTDHKHAVTAQREIAAGVVVGDGPWAASPDGTTK